MTNENGGRKSLEKYDIVKDIAYTGVQRFSGLEVVIDVKGEHVLTIPLDRYMQYSATAITKPITIDNPKFNPDIHTSLGIHQNFIKLGNTFDNLKLVKFTSSKIHSDAYWKTAEELLRQLRKENPKKHYLLSQIINIDSEGKETDRQARIDEYGGKMAEGGEIITDEDDKIKLWKRIVRMKDKAWGKYTNANPSEELLYLNRYEKYKQQEENIVKELGYMDEGGSISSSPTYDFDRDWNTIKSDILNRNYHHVIFTKDNREYLYMPYKYGSDYNEIITANKEDFFKKASLVFSDGGLIAVEILHDTRYIQKAVAAGRQYIYLCQLTAPRHCYATRSASVYSVGGKFILYKNNLLCSKYYIHTP